MNILIVDQLSIFIQGMSVGLKNIMPDLNVKGVNDLDTMKQALDENLISIVLLDGEMARDRCISLLDDITLDHPKVRVVVMLNKIKKSTLRFYLRHHAIGVISKNASLETIGQVLRTASCGMVCVPDENFEDIAEDQSLTKLSQRQREILRLIAAGESNKQISRVLNISAGTVKSHLESIYRRLNVKNRTQAAMMLSLDE